MKCEASGWVSAPRCTPPWGALYFGHTTLPPLLKDLGKTVLNNQKALCSLNTHLGVLYLGCGRMFPHSKRYESKVA